ncbi:hypothetical protein, partial [Sphingomonas sp. 3-13AW]|uniref:hypothetical protein n=1 Tax=Sphingomonas sp. 3-13AW TaxID=3050450 RepID=UPI003BB5542D
MTKPITARHDLTIWRNDDYYEYPIRVVGVDLTNTALAMEVRLGGDVPGPAIIALGKVVPNLGGADYETEGVQFRGVSVVDGTQVSDVRIRMHRGTLQGLPYFGEVGDPAEFEYALVMGGRTRLSGRVVLPAHPYRSDSAPASRVSGYGSRSAVRAASPDAGVTLTIAKDGGATVVIDGADLIGGLREGVEEARIETVAAARRTEAIASTSYRAVATYGAREGIPLDQRGAGMRVHVLEAERTFEWRSDLFAPGAWVGLRTEEELSRLDLMHGGLSQEKVYGLLGTLDALREADSAAVAVKILSPRAVALSSAANPRGYVEWATAGQPTSHVVSWGGRAITLDGQARRMDFPSYSLEQPFAFIGNSLSDPTDVTDRWTQQLAARYGQPFTSVARYSSDARMVYRSGAKPIVLTLAGALPASGSVAVSQINGAPIDGNNPAAFLTTGDAGLTTGMSMSGLVARNGVSRRVTVSAPNGGSFAYRVTQEPGQAAITFDGPVTFVPDFALSVAGRTAVVWIGNNYFYSGVPNEYGDHTNPQMWVDLKLIVAFLQARGCRVLLLPILPNADWTERGPGTSYDAHVAGNVRTDALFPGLVA